MSDCSAFHTQLASIMEVLANTAVAEICQLVDDGYAVLRLEMSRSHKENESLKRKLKMLELSRMRAERTGTCSSPDGVAQVSSTFRRGRDQGHVPAVESGFGVQMGVTLCRDRQPTAEREERAPVVSREKKQCADVLNVKEEILEHSGTRDPPGEVNINEDRAVEWRAGSREKRPVQETQNKPAKHTEELTEQHRTRRAVWEVSGLESALKTEPSYTAGNKKDQHLGTENGSAGLYHLDSEYLMFGRISQPGAFLIPEVGETEAENSAGPYGPVTDSENLSVELIDVTSAVNGCTSSDTHFITSEGIPTHCKDVTRKKWFVCKYCGKNFSRRNVLEKHHRVHTGEKPFSCLLCGKKFSDSSNLKKHQSVHTGEKPFRCAQCGKRFSDSSSRKRHQTVHTGKKPFGCAECGKRFTRSCHLKRHCQQFHSWQIPFSEHGL
ncbi:hypothetical protein SKAU_G00344780 [Synaphobranchus kaupii]|uniref:C2H2-type domain-containing protein n=1 Tax=Synaphobranchus kaupii TaxID=118154 RepID=A0A9Q1EJC1_SYNKA|nr:hypothetical protein SKAU_G00344780 [Synaphobranchus kaupii]